MIHSNDLPNAIHSDVSMYADDTSLCHASNNISKLESVIDEDLLILDNWLKGNMLSHNVAKTIIICTKSRQRILRVNDDELNLLIYERRLE